MKVIPEQSNFRIGWDLLIIVLILISCTLIPFQIVFWHAAYKLGSEIIYFIDLIFLIDILLNFFTSYRHQGVEVTGKNQTARHYLKTVFAVRPTDNGYEFHIVRQTFRPSPQASFEK